MNIPRVPFPHSIFIEPFHATQRDLVPKHGSWLHEIKHDGSPTRRQLDTLLVLAHRPQSANSGQWPHESALVRGAIRE
jgi:hypothetical protein